MSAIQSTKVQAAVREMDASMRRHKALKKTNPAAYRMKLEEENEFLFEIFPTIFEMHFEGKLDETFFEMLRLRRKIELGEMTDDQASRLIGQKLFDRYVGPIVNNTPPPEKPLSYSEFYKQFETNASSKTSDSS
jgi:hypothetical protein